MATSSRAPVRVLQTETDVAVLQVQVQSLEEKLDDMRSELKEIRETLETVNMATQKMVEELKTNATAMKSLTDKVSGLEKWRWMLMGAGLVLGGTGHSLIAALLK